MSSMRIGLRLTGRPCSRCVAQDTTRFHPSKVSGVRGPFEHNGSVASPEDWSNSAASATTISPQDLSDTTFQTRPVRGHEFHLKISAEDKKALIAFLKTL